MNVKALIVAAGFASLAASMHAAEPTDAAATSAASSAGYADGEVKKIDYEQGKITLKHGPIDNLGMPGMTMVFRADAKTLDGVNVGDSVKFKADKVDGAIKVTELVGQ